MLCMSSSYFRLGCERSFIFQWPQRCILHSVDRGAVIGLGILFAIGGIVAGLSIP